MSRYGPFSDSWRDGFVPNANPGAAFGGLFDDKGRGQAVEPLGPPDPPTAAEIKAARKAMGLSAARLALCLGASERTIQEWESGAGRSRRPRRNEPPAYLALALVELARHLRRRTS